jgi:LacI family transcriptional regulator
MQSILSMKNYLLLLAGGKPKIRISRGVIFLQNKIAIFLEAEHVNSTLFLRNRFRNNLVNMSQEVTIKQLAGMLQVSIATVSKALRNSHEISEETILRVKKLAEELNYMPDPYASSLRSRKSNTISIVIPEIADSFFSQAINGIASVANVKGYHVLIYLTHESFKKEQEIFKEFHSGRAEGVLISVSAETTESDHIEQLINMGIPVLIFDRIIENIETVKISTDDFDSSYKATSHLIENGCRKIALLSISDSLSISVQRKMGFEQALINHSIPFDKNSIVHCSFDEANNYALVRLLLDKPNHPDGILSTVEKFTSTVYSVCNELEFNIPKDLKLVSFSNLGTARFLEPSLTTITQPAYEIGKLAAEMLFATLSRKSFRLKNENIVIPSLLDIRKSSMQSV